MALYMYMYKDKYSVIRITYVKISGWGNNLLWYFNNYA